MEELSPSMEDYIKEIYRLSLTNTARAVRVSDIALAMGITKASVSNATKVLQRKALLTKDKSKGISLTESGLQYAEFITRRHAVLKRFLLEVLQLKPATAQDDACGMEHVVSRECYEAMQFFLESNRSAQTAPKKQAVVC